MLFLGVTVFPAGGGAVCALTQEGEAVWQYDTESPVYSCPAYSGGAVVVTTNGGRIISLDATTGALLWEHKEAGDEFDTSCAIAQDRVYVTSHAGKMICLDRATGEVLRRWLSPSGNPSHSSPAVGSGPTEGQLFFGADDRNIYVVSTENARTIAAHTTGGMVPGSPAVSDDLAYVGSQNGALYVVGPQSFQLQTAYRLPDGIHVASSPAIGSGQIVFAASDGYIYVLEASADAAQAV